MENSELKNHFPASYRKITSLRNEDPDFNEMCDDFEMLVRAFNYWKKASKSSSDKIAEYENQLHDLEREINQYLENII